MTKYLACIPSAPTVHFNENGHLTADFILSPISRESKDERLENITLTGATITPQEIARIYKDFKKKCPARPLTTNEISNFVKDNYLAIFSQEKSADPEFLKFVATIGGEPADNYYYNNADLILKHYDKIVNEAS